MATVNFKHTPYGDLALISMRGCDDISAKVDYYLKQWRNIPDDETFVIPANCPRFGTGEAKAVLKHRHNYSYSSCLAAERCYNSL